MRYLKVKNWERFQHYKSAHPDAAPAWIKLYRSLLSDYEFQVLPDAAKGHLMLIWLLSSQTRGRIPDDPKWVADKIGANSKVDLTTLVKAGFLTLESEPETTLECFSKALTLEEEEEEEEEEEKKQILKTDAAAPVLTLVLNKLTPEELVDGWNAICGDSAGLPKVKELTGTRRQHVLARLREHPTEEWWETTLNKVANSMFCRGLRPPKVVGQKPFRVDFDWLVANDLNALKVYEGKYDNEKKTG